MKKYFILILGIVLYLNAETLFQVKDASNFTVLDVSTDGLRVMNLGDTLMVISSTDIKANLRNSKGLSRSFSVTTSTTKGTATDLMKLTSDSTRFWISDNGSGFGVAKGSALKGVNPNLLEVSTSNAKMREGTGGKKYTYFSPDNIFLGLNSGIVTTPGSPSANSGKNNIFLGNESGKSNSSGYDNVLIGDSAGVSNTSGNLNVFIGSAAGKSNTYGHDNIYIGYKPGYKGTGASQNIFIGNYSGYNNTTTQNLFIGEYSGEKNTSGDRNSFVGFFAGQDNSIGTNNSYFGQMAGKDNLSSCNTMLGYWSGGLNLNGANNTFIGYRSGVESDGSNNVFLGYQAGEHNYGSGNIMMGYQAGKLSQNVSNSLYIANSDTSSPLIKGTFPNTDLTFTANTVSVVHPTGIENGFYIKNGGYANDWHFYQYSTGGLYLYYNGVQRGSWNTTTGVYTATPGVKMKNIEELVKITDKVMKLQPKRYNFIGEEDENRKYIGLIAQDVQEIFPEFVYYHKEDDTYSIDYAGMSVVAIQAIKEQKNEIDELKNTNDQLIKRIEEIERKLNK